MNDSPSPSRTASETLNTAPVQFFDDDGVDLPAGTYARPDRRVRKELLSWRIRWVIIAAAAVVALLSGLLLGRFLPH